MTDMEIKQIQEFLQLPDIELKISKGRYKCVSCGCEIPKGVEAFHVPPQNRWCCKSCGNDLETVADIINKNNAIKARQQAKLIKDKKPAKKQEPKEQKQEAPQVSGIRQQILDKCKQMYSPYRKYSAKTVNAEIDRLVADGKTEPGILYTLNWWYSKNESNPELAHGRLGIIDVVYNEAMKNYQTKEGVKRSLKNAEDPQTVNIVVRENTRKHKNDLFQLD